MSEEAKQLFAARMDFLITATTFRELRGWPNDPVHNAAIVYELYGWRFDRFDADLIRAEALAHQTAEERDNG
jgi:hypothetical protein